MASALTIFALVTACSSPPTPPPDTRPLGNATAAPQECDLISANAIKLATGFDDYRAVATKGDKGLFVSCSVVEDLSPEGKLGLVVEIFDPSPHDSVDLENTKVATEGTDLPAELGPGFVARRMNGEDQTIAFVYGWTPDYERLLTINIVEGAPGRDSAADATEFFRQLKPLLLDKPR
ncbi:hypothetical protein LDL08_26615 [Nonomuraea glycinis]|uniref:DUF3558 domain-containing protein n=1 Tax=Nonomuraea glycinis TaxID=2047744 RepID=A0A918AGD3_9ACTN|nr:hypothetical protein [Nonomuraea glycinis]MCA2179757.1 hypothetical protein [Nonomuraea glycinis]GGP16526.1 hypothetical protein GCM10012278_80670 [Nonomuraea glycinis]